MNSLMVCRRIYMRLIAFRGSHAQMSDGTCDVTWRWLRHSASWLLQSAELSVCSQSLMELGAVVGCILVKRPLSGLWRLSFVHEQGSGFHVHQFNAILTISTVSCTKVISLVMSTAKYFPNCLFPTRLSTHFFSPAQVQFPFRHSFFGYSSINYLISVPRFVLSFLSQTFLFPRGLPPEWSPRFDWRRSHFPSPLRRNGHSLTCNGHSGMPSRPSRLIKPNSADYPNTHDTGFACTPITSSTFSQLFTLWMAEWRIS